MSCQMNRQRLVPSLIILFLFLLFSPHFCCAATVASAATPAMDDKEKIIFSALWKEIHGEYPVVDGGDTPTPQPAPAPVPTPSPAPSPEPTPVKKSETTPAPEPKKLSKGESYVQEALKRNRELLKKQNEERKQKEKAADLSYEGNESFVDEMKKKEDAFRNESREDVQNSYANWKKDRDQTYEKWAQERDKFLGKIPQYKENLYSFDSLGASGEASPSKGKNLGAAAPEAKKIDLAKIDKNKYFFVDGALDLPIKDQGNRPTCSSFAGVRAVEVLWQQKHKESLAFSEQYFYFASKPQCQQDKCSNKGSWVIPGVEHSVGAYKPDIPLEKDCPYQNFPVSGNETQIPLSSGCQKGKVKIEKYTLAQTFNDILFSLTRNKPVVGGFKLTENFYQNNGIVYLSEAKSSGGKMDEHAKGHALLLVGYIELPKERQAKEGKLCLVVANSWGEGFGQGGYTCLSERWFNQYRFEMPFVVIEEIRS